MLDVGDWLNLRFNSQNNDIGVDSSSECHSALENFIFYSPFGVHINKVRMPVLS